MKETGKKASSQIRESIERCIERMQIEGNNIIQLPEQFAAVYLIRRWEEKVVERREWINGRIPFTEHDKNVILNYWHEYQMIDDSEKNRLWNRIELTDSLILLQELWNLTDLIKDEYRDGVWKDRRSMKDIMEYMLDAIFRKGNKEYFFTPSNIAQLMLELLAPKEGKLIDPACGSGTFLWKAAERWRLFIEGWDINAQMIKTAQINLFFHGIKENEVNLKQADFMECQEMADYILANPPVSSVQSIVTQERGHIVRTRLLHLQFLQHIMEVLREGGKAAVLINESLLFSVRTAERRIRKALVEEYGLEDVISLPKKAFAPYTNAKSSILIFGGRQHSNEQPVFFYEMEQLGYSLDKYRNAIDENDIPDVLQKEKNKEGLYWEWRRAKDRDQNYNADGIAVPAQWNHKKYWFADREQIREQDYILLPGRYKPLDKEAEEELASPEELIEKIFGMEQEIQKCLEAIGGILYEE